MSHDIRTDPAETPDCARAFWCGMFPQVAGGFGLFAMYAWALAPSLLAGTVDLAEGVQLLPPFQHTAPIAARCLAFIGQPFVLGPAAALWLLLSAGLLFAPPTRTRCAWIYLGGAVPVFLLVNWCTVLGIVLPHGVLCIPKPIEFSAWSPLPFSLWIVGGVLSSLLRRRWKGLATLGSEAESFVLQVQILALVLLLATPSARPTLHLLGMAFPGPGETLLGIPQAVLAVVLCEAAHVLLLLRAGAARAAACAWLALLVSCASVLVARVHLEGWTRPFGN